MHTMTRAAALTAAAIASGCAFIGCTADVHDNTADIHDNTVNVDATLTFAADDSTDDLEAGASVSVTMDATGVVLVDPNDDPPSSDADKAAHFAIYLDDEDSEPLVLTANASVAVTIPADTSEGKHSLICRLRNHDGSATNQHKEVSITVSASASVMVGADAGF